MLKFQQFDRRSGETFDVRPCVCNFGITEALIPIIASLATSAGAGAATAGTIASIAAPALVSAGLGAGSSALFGGDPGQGALFGGLGGALGPVMNAVGLTGSGGVLGSLFGGSGGALTGQAAQDLESGAAGAGAGGAGAAGAALDAEGNPLSSYNQAANVSGALSGAAPAASSGGGGAFKNLSLPMTLGVLSMIGQMSNRPKTTQAPTPPGFNNPWNPTPSATLARTPNPFAPTTNYYTYGQQAQPGFFNNNALTFQPQPAMARGGALRAAMDAGKYQKAGGGALGGNSFVRGGSGGQDDDVDAKLSNGEYVFDAGSVSRLGDGNNEAGAKKLDEMRSMIANDSGAKHVVQNKTRPALSYLKAVA